MGWQEQRTASPHYGTGWHRQGQSKTPFCRFESCTAHQKKALKRKFQGFFAVLKRRDAAAWAEYAHDAA